MKKGYRYLIAFAACAVIFVIWVIFQMCVARGVLVGVLFCGAMAGTWKAIVSGDIFGGDEEEKQPDENTDAVVTAPKVDPSIVESSNEVDEQAGTLEVNADGSPASSDFMDDASCVESSNEVEPQPTVQETVEVVAGETPDETKSPAKLIDDLKNIAQGTCDIETLKRVYYYQSTLLIVGSDKSKARVIDSTMRRKDSGITEKIAGDIYDYVLKEYAKKTFGNDDDHLMEMLNASFGNVENNCNGDIIKGTSGPYGVCATNPIPVRGIPSSEGYLGHLRTMNGGKLTWKRLGSSRSPITDKPIDIYYMYDEKGVKVGEVYISPYQAITSKTAPEGFMYV